MSEKIESVNFTIKGDGPYMTDNAKNRLINIGIEKVSKIFYEFYLVVSLNG
jgi:hypothetical protein